MIKYRASFSGPRGSLNPLGLQLPGQVKVEVFPTSPTGRRFKARTVTDAGAPLRVLKFEHSASEISGPADTVKAQVSRLFDNQESEWREMEEYERQ